MVDYTAEQKALEIDALSGGVARYNKQLTINGNIESQPGQRLFGLLVEPLAKAITETMSKASGKRSGRRASVLPKLEAIQPGVLASITVRVVIQSIGNPNSKSKCARAIGQMISEHDDWAQFTADADSKGISTHMKRAVKEYGNETIRRNVARNAVTRYATNHWTEKEMMTVGVWALTLLNESTSLIEVTSYFSRKSNKQVWNVQASAEAEEKLAEGHHKCEGLKPIYMPMIVKPRAWTGLTGGGYLKHKLSLIKTSNTESLNDIATQGLDEVCDAVNALQDVPYRINKSVLGVLQETWASNSQFPSIPNRDDELLPNKPHDIETNEESRNDYSNKARQVHVANAKRRGKRIGIMSKLLLAERMEQYPEIFFPHQCDWRGRVYPVPVYLQPQGDDIAKSLLQFAEGKALTEDGVPWFKIHIANLYGADKLSLEERVQWVDNHHDELLATAFDPMDNDFWRVQGDAKHQWQALAAAFEYAGYAMEGAAYVSHMAIAMDGSCNGLQNLSAMLKDEVGGTATNLIPSDKPEDIYQQVAALVTKRLTEEGTPEAARWLKLGIARQLVKRPVMTKPYGVTSYGMTDHLLVEMKEAKLLSNAQQMEWLPEGVTKQDKGYFYAASYLAKHVEAAIGEIVVASKEVMDWLQEIAKVSAAENLPLHWTNPVGFPILQDYRKFKTPFYRHTIGGVEVHYRLSKATTKINTKKQSDGASPNVIHSFDAAHMMKTVNQCVSEGVTSLAMIHDSYGTHACDVGTMNVVLREEFIKMYTQPVLQDLYDQFVAQVEPEVAADFPPVPAMGTLDLAQVKDSLYFFA